MKKAPFPTIRVLLAVGLSMATLITLHALAQSPAANNDSDNGKFILRLPNNPGEYHPLKDPSSQGQDKFVALFCGPQARPFDKSKRVHFKGKKEGDLPADCDKLKDNSDAQLKINTDRVIASEKAKKIEAGESSAVGDPHVTIQVASQNSADIIAVLDQL